MTDRVTPLRLAARQGAALFQPPPATPSPPGHEVPGDEPQPSEEMRFALEFMNHAEAVRHGTPEHAEVFQAAAVRWPELVSAIRATPTRRQPSATGDEIEADKAAPVTGERQLRGRWGLLFLEVWERWEQRSLRENEADKALRDDIKRFWPRVFQIFEERLRARVTTGGGKVDDGLLSRGGSSSTTAMVGRISGGERAIIDVYERARGKGNASAIKPWMAAELKLPEDSIRWCEQGDWFAIATSDRYEPGYYAIPNPSTAHTATVQRLRTLFPGMDPDTLRSEYRLQRLPWLPEDMLVAANFNMDAIDRTGLTEDMMGEVGP